MTMLKSLILFTVASLATLFIAGCRHSGPRRPVVTVSIDPQAWLLKRIAGDKVEVNVLLSGDADPENFDPPMSVLRNAAKSTAYMRMGYLPWESALVERVTAANAALPVFDTSEGIEPVTGSHHHAGHEHDDMADPHTWSSVKNARIIASNMLRGLLAVDPANASAYREGYSQLAAELDSLDRSFARRLEPLRGSAFVVWHPSLSYFARDYGLEQVALGADGKELSLPALQTRLDEAREADARVLFVQPQLEGGGKAELIARQTGARTAVINPMSGDWRREMENVVDALTEK